MLIALSLSNTAPVSAQAKWWWEKYPSATDKTLSLQTASGGQVIAKQNPTGANGSVAGNNATQPPTVIIQQTASAVASNQMTCVQTVTSASGGNSYNYGTTISTCPNITGYQVTPIVGGGFSTSYVSNYVNNTSVVNNPIMACCYVPVAGPTTGGAAYSPWASNQAFNNNGFSGTQKQEFLNSGNYSWTVPGGVYRIWVTVIGGGGGGGAGAYSNTSAGYAYSGGGGGRGGTGYRRPIDVIPGSSITVRVGAGGVGGSTTQSYSGQPGQPGGSSYATVSGYTVEAQGGFGGSGGFEAQGYYPPQPPNPSTFVLSNPSSGTCSNSTCTGQGGLPGHLAVGSGKPISGSLDGGSGRGAPGASSAAYGEGNAYNPTGAGKSGTPNTFGGGGGAAGFIGMPYSTAVPYALNGTNGVNGMGATSGAGGYGYGAGGGGGAGGAHTPDVGRGGAGATGAVWIEW